MNEIKESKIEEQSYYYRTLYLIEALSLLDSVNKDRERHGRKSVDLDTCNHDHIKDYIDGKYQQLLQGIYAGESVF